MNFVSTLNGLSIFKVHFTVTITILLSILFIMHIAIYQYIIIFKKWWDIKNLIVVAIPYMQIYDITVKIKISIQVWYIFIFHLVFFSYAYFLNLNHNICLLLQVNSQPLKMRWVWSGKKFYKIHLPQNRLLSC